jgi:magnesium-transporting ATPase (P-type)
MILQFELKTADFIAFYAEYNRKKLFIFNHKVLIISVICGILLGFNKTHLFGVSINGHIIPENILWTIVLNIIVVIVVIFFLRYFILLLIKNHFKHTRNLEGRKTLTIEYDLITITTDYTRLEFKASYIFKIETFQNYCLLTLCNTEKIIIPVTTPGFEDFMKNLIPYN